MAEISISACRTALQWAWCRRQAGIPLKLQGRQVVIDRPVEARGKNWVCGDLVLGRAEQLERRKAADARCQAAADECRPGDSQIQALLARRYDVMLVPSGALSVAGLIVPQRTSGFESGRTRGQSDFSDCARRFWNSWKRWSMTKTYSQMAVAKASRSSASSALKVWPVA